MGFLLKEALKSLCGSSQWAYAVFWKIGCQNPKLLIWEECHYEPSICSIPKRTAETGRADLQFGEWEGYWVPSEVCPSSICIQPEERVSSLVNRMMMDKPFNIVGEGIVGRAAFTGSHQWILSSNYTEDGHLPEEVLNEMQHQFSAGMQTVVVIPVLPHGVVQLGSSLAMMENIGVINDVKSLILRLGCVPGALLSENYATKDLVEKAGVSYTAGMLAPMHPSGHYEVAGSSQMTDNYSHRSHTFRDSGHTGQLSHRPLKYIQSNSETTASTFQTPNLTRNLPKIHDDTQQPMVAPMMKPNLSFGGQLKDGVGGAEVVTSSSDARLKQLIPSFNSRGGLNYPSSLGLSGADLGSLKLMEQKILSGGSIGYHLDNYFSASNGIIPQLRTNGSFILDQDKGLSNTSLLGGSQAHGGSSSHSRPISVPCSLSDPQRAADNHCGGHLSGVKFQKADAFQIEGVSASSVAGQSASQNMLSKGSDQGQLSTDVERTQSELAPRAQRIDDVLFQALTIPLTSPDEHMSLSVHIPNTIPDYKICSPGSANATHDACTQIASGDDLFDVLGMDFKNKLFNDNWKTLLADEIGSTTKDLCENTSTFTNVPDLGFDYFSAGQGVSNSSIFSGAGADHLLDAVVARAQSAVKQSSDDNVSCRTTLTKLSSSSVPRTSPTCGQVSMCNHVHGETFGLPKVLGKAGIEETSSFQSGCSRGDVGNCSQTTSIYGSQISSWTEQGNNAKHENSVSTAYSKKPDVMGKSDRKRLKPGENPRPRPKDRQMIQDRVKELRDIVPNGAKCSIDALLERTIKHMLFLQSVTKHADKLKQIGESKIIGKEGGLVLKDNFDGGATWAFEVGSQSMVCPIIVEDLNPPRQMLVEMLCEEQGFFLEIADLIRGLGLTILKGVMEARDDKIWARFAVEANRDVTRMEIFMSLVHLWEQTGKGTASSINAMKNSMMVHHSFAQVAPIPATGRPSILQ